MQAGGILSPQYATEATDAILDANGRLSARAGVTNVTTTPIAASPIVRTLFERRKADESTEIIVAWDGGISTSLTNPSGSDISGAVTDANGRWRFQSFNDKVLGFQAGQKLIVRTAGNFATVVETSGTAPTGEVAMAAYGRVWQTDSTGKVIQYSGLLNETQWSTGGAGTIDMNNIWTDGQDTITALAAFNGALVVFGKRHIVFFVDGKGSALGLDPTVIYVVDVITGTGCLSQYTVQPVGETDLLFLSPNGVQSIQRVIQEKSTPIASLSDMVRTELLTKLASETILNIRSSYNPLYGFYLLSFPATGQVWVFDQRRRYRNDDNREVSITTRWSMAPTALLTTLNNTLYIARTGGKVGQYSGTTDEGTVFRFVYQSPWLDLGEDLANRLKMLKRLGSIIYSEGALTVIFKWSVDFSSTGYSATVDIPASTAAGWGSAEWGLGEWSDGVAIAITHTPVRAKWQYIRLGIEADINGAFALQQIESFSKIGRLA
jgi:hypothetical protein